MPSQTAIRRAERDRRQGKSASTQAGEFVRDEIERIRGGAHGARSAKQAIAIGLSEARKAGVKLPPRPGQAKAPSAGKGAGAAKTTTAAKKKSARRSQATLAALRREPRNSVSPAALSRHASESAARPRTPPASTRPPPRRCAPKATPALSAPRKKPRAPGRADKSRKINIRGRMAAHAAFRSHGDHHENRSLHICRPGRQRALRHLPRPSCRDRLRRACAGNNRARRDRMRQARQQGHAGLQRRQGGYQPATASGSRPGDQTHPTVYRRPDRQSAGHRPGRR